MKRLDAAVRGVDRFAHDIVEPFLRLDEFRGRGFELGQFAAVESPRQRAQRRVAIGTHLRDDARYRARQFGIARRRWPLQDGVARGSIQRRPLEDRTIEDLGAEASGGGGLTRMVAHASIFSTGNTSNWRAPARFMSSRCCQVIAPWQTACSETWSLLPSIGNIVAD